MFTTTGTPPKWRVRLKDATSRVSALPSIQCRPEVGTWATWAYVLWRKEHVPVRNKIRSEETL